MAVHYILSLLFAPVLAVLAIAIIWKKRGKDRYPGIIKSFVLGALSIVITLIFMFIASKFGLDVFSNVRRIIFYSFVVMGIGSELGKFLILRYSSFPKHSFNGPLDGIVYSIIISMGFAFMGNVLYFTLPYYTEVDFLYAYTVVLGNLFFAVIMGFFVGMGKSRENKFVDSMTGLFGASFFHALYNFCFITHDIRLLVFLSIGAFVIVIMLYYKAFEMNEEYKRIKDE
ncbi:MAG TPA: PrsW family glutamic-type intramembrane protease [Bacteroidales bacterium]|nr:PrsW family glutamic-type intramembrane protease [Bacteroidales bacterium]HRX97360.1 PrsW family glutamic-type intramembrane protease [Bacteroidales bacterium]